MTAINITPPVIAHRGASAYAPENTLAAFTKAAQLGVKWIEFDVMQAACGEAIIFHDDTLERTTNGAGEPSDYHFQTLAALDAGRWFDLRFASEKIPSLHQVIDFLINTNMNANVEIKSMPGKEAQLIKRVFQELSQSELGIVTPRLLFSSFSLDALKLLRQYAPSCYLGMLLHEWEPNWQTWCVALNCISVHVNEAILTHEAASKIKAMNKLLLCYTVNDPERAKELFSWGVDAVFSDNPDKILCVI